VTGFTKLALFNPEPAVRVYFTHVTIIPGLLPSASSDSMISFAGSVRVERDVPALATASKNDDVALNVHNLAPATRASRLVASLAFLAPLPRDIYVNPFLGHGVELEERRRGSTMRRGGHSCNDCAICRPRALGHQPDRDSLLLQAQRRNYENSPSPRRRLDAHLRSLRGRRLTNRMMNDFNANGYSTA
jgi:hypothetical protein